MINFTLLMFEETKLKYLKLLILKKINIKLENVSSKRNLII